MSSTLLGEAAYNAYADNRERMSVKGDPLPTWSDQDPLIKTAWILAGEAAVRRYKELHGEAD